MHILDQYRRAQDGFDRIVAALPAASWDNPSACAVWSNRDVLGHVVWGQHLVKHLATGRQYESRVGAPGAPNPGVLVTDDPVGTWRAARAASVPTLDDAALAREMELGAFGRVSLAFFVQALVVDFLAHTWDIGRPAGLAVRLDPELVPGALEWTTRLPARSPELIGPAVEPPPGADEQTRLMAGLGRRVTAWDSVRECI
jgi:uncharacterized protein (TIGR03086 family)